MPKQRRSRAAPRHVALAEQIVQDGAVRPGTRDKRRGAAEEDDGYVDEKLSRRILEQARIQQEELEAEHGAGPPLAKEKPTVLLGYKSRSNDSDSEDEEWPTLQKAASMDAGSYSEDVQVNPEEEKAIEMFMNKNPPLRRTLADIIMEKITEKQTEVESVMSEVSGRPMPQLDPRVLEVYKGVKEVWHTRLMTWSPLLPMFDFGEEEN